MTARHDSDVRAAAHADHESVVTLIQRLVRTPSRGGIDPYLPAIEMVEGWLFSAGLRPRRLADSAGAPLAVVCDITGDHPGPRIVLDACLDTAPFGDEDAWAYPPSSGAIVDGWLHGRGAADSKAAVAIFCHLGARLAQQTDRLHGTATLLFDADEHTGRFGGAREYFTGAGRPDDIAGVYIGYPGLDQVVIGGRGVWRARLTTYGVAGHSGSSRASANAIDKAAELIALLRTAEMPASEDPDFPLPPKLTVTEIHGGEGFSVTPDACRLSLDVRLTPSFDGAAAQLLLHRLVTAVDGAWAGTAPTTVEVVTEWPPYRLEPTSALVEALVGGAADTGLAPTLKVAGPSNIGNYLSGLGVAATAGFGAVYEGLHGTDERIRLDTLPAVQSTYHHAMLTLLGGVTAAHRG